MKLEDGDDYHYVYIKDYDKLIGSQTNKHNEKYHCFHCNHGFKSQALLDEHSEKGCMAVEGQRIEMRRTRHILWPDRVEGTSQNPPTQWKTQSEGLRG